jgi:CheY-like chemotaxis protein
MSLNPLVLVVDDDADTRELLAEFLTTNGYAVAMAISGREALESVGRLEPRAILMDLAMPQMNGAEAIRHIKSNQATAYIPIILITAHAFPEQLNVARAAGCDDVLIKPLDLKRLLDVLARWAPRTAP